MSTLNLDDNSFDNELENSDLPLVVDFWAEWCGPCKQMAPHLDKVAEEMSQKVRIAKLNVDDNPMTASKYGVRGLPTLMLFKDGKVITTHMGAMSKSFITNWINDSLKQKTS